MHAMQSGRTAVAWAGLIAGLLCSAGVCFGDFVGASMELVQDDGPGGNWTWRVFADFDDPANNLIAVGAIPVAGVFQFQSATPLVNDGQKLADTFLEDFPAGDLSGPRDSWVTIGDDLSFPSPTEYSPGFAGGDGAAAVIVGESLSEADGGWFNNNPGMPVTGTHILIGQFTVASGSNISMSGLAFWELTASGTLWDPEDNLGFITSFFEVAIVPAPTGACCLLDASGCIDDVTSAECVFLLGTYQGDDTTCATTTCPEPMGACCLSDASCVIETEAECLTLGGVFQFVGVPCGAAECPQPGACCFDDGSCEQSAVFGGADCVGVYQGDDTLCASSNCPQPGVCCLPDGTCVPSMVLGGADCAGDYQGDDSTCATSACPGPGACCFDDGSCMQSMVVGGADCAGVYLGDGTECATVACPQPGACCFPDGTCVQSTLVGGADCAGDYQGDDTDCDAGVCPQPGACCLPDGSCEQALVVGGADCVGVYQGDQTLCMDVKCPQPMGFAGASLELVEDDGPGGDWTWRVYIDFHQPTDVLLAVGASAEDGVFRFEADTPLFNDGGKLAGTRAEDFPSGDIAGPRDSWVTIGDDLSLTNPTDYSPGFAGSDGKSSVIIGMSIFEDDGGWFNSDPGTPVMGTHILVAQFTVASGSNMSISGFAFWESTPGFAVWSPEGSGFNASFFELSIVPAPIGACCLLDGTCTEITSATCEALSGAYEGDETTCDSTVCPEPMGACCLVDGSCVIDTLAGCLALGGAPQGIGISCIGTICPQAGACCFEDGSCEQSTLVGGADCDGQYQGDDTFCLSVVCPQPGACCFDDGSCEQALVLGGADCTGVYQGDDTDCATASCPQPGVCCLPDGSCVPSLVLGGADCAGDYQGDDSTCATSACPGPGACCFDDGSCMQSMVVGGADCSGVYQGDGTECATVGCPQPGACCLADGSCEQSAVVAGADCAGDYQGDDTDCATASCPQPGACCFADGSCEQSTVVGGADCAGDYHGDDTDCGSAACPQPGACCLPDGSCLEAVLAKVCGTKGGTFTGEGTVCASAVCVGACCLSDQTCVDELSPQGCIAMSGAFQGLGTDCLGTDCLTHVLIYEDLVLGTSAYVEAVTALGWEFTYVTDGFVFEFELQTGVYTHVIAGHHNTSAAGAWEDDLADWALGHPGSPVLISDWRVNTPQPYLAELGFSYTGTTNHESIEAVSGGVFDGLASSAIVSPGWGIFAYGVDGPDIEATTIGGDEMVVARNGNWFFNGFLSDTFEDQAVGIEYVIRELTPSFDGACCFADSTCRILGSTDCVAAGGFFQGDFTDCVDVACQPGACCLDDGSCVQSSVVGGADCVGVYQGEDTECDMVSCPQPGACCLADATCVEVLATACDAQGGTFGGADTLCADTTCTGACCLTDQTCFDTLSPLACVESGGFFQGPGTACSAGCGCEPSEVGDVDGDGFTSYVDLLFVLAGWGACELPPPMACTGDVDCNGLINFDDLMIVLQNWNPQ